MIVGAPLQDQIAQTCATMRAAAALGREAWAAGASAMEAVARRRPGCCFHLKCQKIGQVKKTCKFFFLKTKVA